jgi:hypothetical protein
LNPDLPSRNFIEIKYSFNQKKLIFMGSEKIFMFGEPSTGGRADLTAILPALMNNNKGIDPSILAMLGNRDGNGRDGFGNDFFAILLLFILMGWGGNNNGGFFGNRGNGGGEGLNILNNDSTRELLMSAIQGNGNAISQLSTQLGCTTGQIQDGINTLNMSLCNVGNQVGMSGQQIINSIQSGNCTLANQIASCCCDVRTSIERQGYESQLAIVNQTNTLQNSASSQFNILGAKIDAQTQILNDKFCQLEMREMQNKIDTLRQENTQLALAASQQAQTANIVSQLKAPCPVPSYIVPNPNCCYTAPYGYGYANDGCGCGC